MTLKHFQHLNFNGKLSCGRFSLISFLWQWLGRINTGGVVPLIVRYDSFALYLQSILMSLQPGSRRICEELNPGLMRPRRVC